MTTQTAGARFGEVLRVRTFRVFYGAELQSIVGDQLARVALAVLVFERTGSVSFTTLIYALTFLPAILGGVLLAHIGDTRSRPAVMITCDVLRAAAFAVMAIPGLPLVVVGALVVGAVFVSPAFTASSTSLLASRLTPAQFRTASGLRMSTNQLAQVLGYAVGGVLVAALGAREALLVNAATYVVSAAIVLRWVRSDHRTADVRTPTIEPAVAAEARGSLSGVIAVVLRDPRARIMVVLSLLAGFFVVPESVAIPFAAQIHSSTAQAGLLLATIPLGAAVGVLLLVRVVPERRRLPVALAMAVATGIPLVVTGFVTVLGVAAACWFLSGIAGAYQIEAFVALVGAVPDGQRARLVSLMSSLLLTVQGLGPIVFGGLASVRTPSFAVSTAGACGFVLAALAACAALRTPSLRAAPGLHRPGAHRA